MSLKKYIQIYGYTAEIEYKLLYYKKFQMSPTDPNFHKVELELARKTSEIDKLQIQVQNLIDQESFINSSPLTKDHSMYNWLKIGMQDPSSGSLFTL